MKLGNRTYTEQEVAIIEVYKNHIQYLQKEIDGHWDTLTSQIFKTDPGNYFKHDYDHLWDYVMNDFKL